MKRIHAIYSGIRPAGRTHDADRTRCACRFFGASASRSLNSPGTRAGYPRRLAMAPKVRRARSAQERCHALVRTFHVEPVASAAAKTGAVVSKASPGVCRAEPSRAEKARERQSDRRSARLESPRRLQRA
eukprot:scaffold7346_cov245-Pinguiococcus_pyrenoidosus.AAC.14